MLVSYPSVENIQMALCLLGSGAITIVSIYVVTLKQLHHFGFLYDNSIHVISCSVQSP